MFPLPPSHPRPAAGLQLSAPRLTERASTADEDSPKHLLVVALDGLRDVVFASALTPLLRSRYPAAEITVWCSEHTASIAKLMPGVDRVESADPCWKTTVERAPGSIMGFARSVHRLRRHAFDAAVLSSTAPRTAMAVALTGSSRRVGYATAKGSRWLTDSLAPADDATSALLEMVRLLAPLGVSAPPALHYRLRTEPLTHRLERLRPLLGPRPVALYPFASERSQLVPLKHWIRVAVELARRGFDPLWIGTSRQLHEVHRSVGSSTWKYIDRLGDGSLADTAAAISLSRLFVGHDSGMLHLASALGISVAGVFTPGDASRAYPHGTGESRLLIRRSPDGVTHDQILDVVDHLPVRPALRLVR